jgi:hypothetical protein
MIADRSLVEIGFVGLGRDSNREARRRISGDVFRVGEDGALKSRDSVDEDRLLILAMSKIEFEFELDLPRSRAVASTRRSGSPGVAEEPG